MSKSKKKKIIQLTSLQQETINNMPKNHEYYIDMKEEKLMFRVPDEEDMDWQTYKVEILGEPPLEYDEYSKVIPGTNNYYIDNREMLLEILKSKQQGKLTDVAVDMFILLSKRVIKRLQKRYKCKEDQEDCMQTGLVHLFKSWHKFDPRKSSNTFAYYTEIFKKGAADGYNKLYKKKGDPNNDISVMSYTSANEGNGMFNIN